MVSTGQKGPTTWIPKMKNFRLPTLVVSSSLAALVAFSGPIPLFQEPEMVIDEAALKQESQALKAIAAMDAVYVGASKCKSCHNKESAGAITDKWETLKHAHAFEVLSSDEAKAVAKERGIEDASKAAECMKCHDTAYSEPEERKHKRFKNELGVQCETCHGPGSAHVTARLAAAKEEKVEEGVIQQIAEGEIVLPDVQMCLSCHNDESPSYKKLDLQDALKTIRHMHPKREKPRVTVPMKKKEG